MEERDINQNNVVEGFGFFTEKDARLAAQEQKKIEYLEARMNYEQPESILRIYRKAIRDRVFKTPVGVFYLKQLQSYLQDRPELEGEEIPDIPLYLAYDNELRDHSQPARNRIQPAKQKKSMALPVSVLLNIGLAIIIIIMFVITLNADQPNILNYERAITNRYASWEQELTEREQAVREKERELKME